MFRQYCCSFGFIIPFVYSIDFHPSSRTMSDKCRGCVKVVGNRQLKVQCSDCSTIFHGACVKLSKEDIDYLTANNEIWRCEQCSKVRRKSMLVETELNKDAVNISDVYKLLQEMREENKKQIKELESELGKSVEMCHGNIADLKKTIESQSLAIKNYQDSFDSLKEENNGLKKKCAQLESRLDDLEQYGRINCLEINGIPEEKNEDVSDIVKKIGNSVGISIEDTDIDACHRLGGARGEDSRRSRGIIVKFVRRSVKEELLHKRRVKRNLNTKDVGFADRPAEVIYINESLSAGRRQVFNAARMMKKENHLQYVWVRNGKVLTRAEDGAKVIVVTAMEQVAALRTAVTATPGSRLATTSNVGV